jgi:hypothetical protein
MLCLWPWLLLVLLPALEKNGSVDWNEEAMMEMEAEAETRQGRRRNQTGVLRHETRHPRKFRIG